MNFLTSSILAAALVAGTCVRNADAATYYIDFGAGNDTAAGTAQGTAWKTIPGTRNIANDAYISANYGNATVSTTNKVQPGDVFRLKCGTTYGFAIGGRVLISPVYYTNTASVASPVTFRRDTNWGSGAVTFNGDSITMASSGEALIEIKDMGGIRFEGISTNGITIQQSERIAIMQYQNSTTYAEGCAFSYMKFISNGTDYNVSGAGGSGSGVLYFGGGSGVQRTIGSPRVEFCEFDGAGLYFNGILQGQTDQRVTNSWVANCLGYNFNGTDPTDVGIVFKAQNSQVTYSNVLGFFSAKGFDSGEEDADDAWPIRYTFIGCESRTNSVLGIGLSNSTRGTQTTNVNYYVISCIVTDCTNGPGIKAYASPFNFFAIGNTLINNRPNIICHHDGNAETNSFVRFTCYNNIAYKPWWVNTSFGNIDTGYWKDTMVTYTRDEDYNAFYRNDASATQYAIVFGGYSGTADVHQFAYGTNGPGYTTSGWYAFQGWAADSHSVGKGTSFTNEPPFVSVVPRSVALTNSFAGRRLTTKGWFIPEMAFDRTGAVRTNWDMGAYEFFTTPVLVTNAMRALVADRALVSGSALIK